MGYKQPRVPPMRAGQNLAQYVREIAAFLRENTMAAWNADRMRDAQMEQIQKRLEALEGKGG
mgnify:CR=1 FL=1